MDTFPWTTIGEPSSVDIEDLVDTLRTAYSGGYTATRPKNSATLKRFIVKWALMEPDEWYALLSFWRTNKSSEAFYMQFPYDLFLTGGSTFFGGVSVEPGDFDSDVSYGSRIFVVRFLEDSLKQRRITKYWSASVVMEEAFSELIGSSSSSESSESL